MVKKNLSIKQIAEMSGVSVATVSRVINKNGRFSKETEEKVLKVIKDNNYKTNLVAKSLRVNQTNTIGVIVPDIKNEFFSSIVAEIEEYFFKKSGFTVFICNSNGEQEKELDYLASLDSKGVDGLIYISGKDDTLHTSVRRDIPVVCIDRKPKSEQKIAIVESNNFRGGYKATKCLIDKHCKNILILKNKNSTSTSLERYRGYCKAIKESSLDFDKSHVINLEKTHFDDAKERIDRLIKEEHKFDGIFAVNDWIALGALYALKGNNKNVPKDVKIIGFDNVSVSRYSYPSITTIEQNKSLMGETASEILLELINNGRKYNDKMHVTLPIKLIERETT
jgi:LacI family transcriptional regulator